MAKSKDFPWPRFYDETATLTELDRLSPAPYEEHKRSLVETWPHVYADANEEQFRNSYQAYLDHCASFYGVCKLGQTVHIRQLHEPNVIVFSRDGRFRRTGPDDVELWLMRERLRWLPPQYAYFCEVFTFGTLYVPDDNLHKAIGEHPGTYRVSHSQGVFRTFLDDDSLIRRIELTTDGSQIVRHAVFHVSSPT